MMGWLTAPPSSTISETCRVQIGFSLVTVFSFLSVFSGGHAASATQGLVKAACLFREGENPGGHGGRRNGTSYRREQSLSIWENQEVEKFQSGKYKTLDFLEGASSQPDGFLAKQHRLAVLLPETLLGPSLLKTGDPPGSTPPSLCDPESGGHHSLS